MSLQVISSVIAFVNKHPWILIGIKIVFIAIIIFGVAQFFRRIINTYVAKNISPEADMLITKAIWYISVLFFGLTVLNELGFSITTLVGAAGVMGIGISFAAQTSLSNIISGIFTLAERRFRVGDTVKDNVFTGKIVAIDLLSLSVKTPDNTLIRVPNEYVIKNIVRNVTYYKERRLDLLVRIHPEEDIDQVKDLIRKTLTGEKIILSSPAISVSVGAMHLFSTDIVVWVWVQTRDFANAYEPLALKLHAACKNNGMSVAITQTN